MLHYKYYNTKSVFLKARGNSYLDIKTYMVNVLKIRIWTEYK